MYSVLQILADGDAGGGTTVVLGLARHLVRHGVSVTIATQAGSHMAREARRSDIPALELEFGSRRRSGLTALALARHFRRAQYSLVHAHGARSSLPVAMLPASLRPRLVSTVHGFYHRPKRPVLRELARRAERFCIRRAVETALVSYNDEAIAREDAIIRERDAYAVIRNGCPPAEPPRAPPSFDVAFLGRLHPHKNPMLLLAVLCAMRPRRPTLCLIGGGEMEAALRQRVAELGLADQVTFCGALRHEDALRQVERARVLMLPSRSEGLPMAVIEAMHRGIPVLASDVTGTAEVVVDGETGFLVPATDVPAYAERLQRLLSDDGLRRAMGARALARAREHFGLDRQMAQYLALYGRAIAGAGRAGGHRRDTGGRIAVP